MALAAFAAEVKPSENCNVIVHVSSHAMEFRPPLPVDLVNSCSPKAEEDLQAAAELLQKEDSGLVVRTELLTAAKGFMIHLMSACYVPAPEDGKIAPLVPFLSIAARNPYDYDRLETEFQRTFPEFVGWMLEKFGALASGNSKGGGKLGQETQASTPGEVPAPPSEPSEESPSTEASPLTTSPVSDGETSS